MEQMKIQEQLSWVGQSTTGKDNCEWSQFGEACSQRQLYLKPVWWSMLSKTIVLGASLVETSPHLDWAATRLNASQHHQSSSHSEQIATNPYSQQIGQFPQNRLNLGLWVLAQRSSWLPYSADLFCSFWSLYVFHKKSKERNMKETQPGN